jgi:hypothetical protein
MYGSVRVQGAVYAKSIDVLLMGTSTGGTAAMTLPMQVVGTHSRTAAFKRIRRSAAEVASVKQRPRHTSMQTD